MRYLLSIWKKCAYILMVQMSLVFFFVVRILFNRINHSIFKLSENEASGIEKEMIVGNAKNHKAIISMGHLRSARNNDL